MRLFVAIPIPGAVKSVIAGALADFPIARPPWRWTSGPNWHLTLKFLGETDSNVLSAVVSALESAAAAVPAFDARLGPFGAFPAFSRPRVLFYALDRGEREAAQLASAVDAALADAIGIDRERRRFHAHATVARVKTPLTRSQTDELTRVPALSGGEFFVDSIDLMRSHLSRQGAYYERVKQFALPQAK